MVNGWWRGNACCRRRGTSCSGGRVREGIDGVERDFYVRQLWDWKVSPPIEVMTPEILKIYAQLCGWTLARGHARSGDRIAIAGYLGTGVGFERAIANFAVAYADQNERDFEAVSAAERN